ncbi:MAG: CHAD domain-containing protein [Microbacterium sp.]|uniref:CHAD domain-containing protein n=1 Tax=Microbacterium sp. TaxID=51671 RepID=UPI0039E42205
MAERETAGEAVTGMLRALAISLRTSEGPLRRDEFDAVHQTRTVVRRLRSILKEYRDVLDRSSATAWRKRLKVWGDALGEVRDAEVRARDGDLMLAQLPSAVADALRPAVVEPAQEAYRRGHDDLLARIRSQEHEQTLREFELFGDAPDLGLLADLPATNTVGDLLVGSAREAVDRAPSRRELRMIRRDPDSALDELHRLRKLARRVRYAAEAAVEAEAFRPRARRRAEKLALAAKAVQDVLGDHRDAVLFAHHIEACEADDAKALARIEKRARAQAARTIKGLRPAVADLKSAAAALARV